MALDRPDVEGDTDLVSLELDCAIVGVDDFELAVCGVVGDCSGIGVVCGEGGVHVGERKTRATSPAPALT